MVREFIQKEGVENMGKRLVNARQGPVEFPPAAMDINTLMEYGKMLTDEQDNVSRIQLADAYLDGAELPGSLSLN